MPRIKLSRRLARIAAEVCAKTGMSLDEAANYALLNYCRRDGMDGRYSIDGCPVLIQCKGNN